jgi:hypothetical protein
MSPTGKLEANAKKGEPWYFYLVMAVVCFGFAAFTNSELKGLETGATESVKIWVPLAFLYRHFGRQFTVWALAAPGAACLVAALWKVVSRR